MGKGNGNKLTLEVKTDCTLNNQDDANLTTNDPLQDDCQR